MEKDTARLEAFSDGIFGVAITLLALDIGIKDYPGPTNLNLWHQILERWPEYLACFNSFAMVLLIWMGHHQILKTVRRADTGAMLLNGLVLFLVVLFPYPTRTAGRFMDTSADMTAVAFYAGFAALITLAMAVLTRYLMHRDHLLLNAEADRALLQTLQSRQRLALGAYSACTGLAFLSPRLALAGTFLMWAFWAVLLTRAEQHLHPPSASV